MAESSVRRPSGFAVVRRTQGMTRSSPGMMLSVQRLQAFARHMGVDLRRRQVGMPQQQLHRAQVCTVVEQVGRERMPQRVR